MNCPRCIYCASADAPRSEEHIFPEGLIGEVEFRSTGPLVGEGLSRLVLDQGEVCISCNSAVAKLDERLQKELGVLRVIWNRTGTKRGTPASTFRPGLFGERRPEGPHLAVNMERRAVVTEAGVVIPPASADEKSVSASLHESDDGTTLSLSQPIVLSKKFIRAVHKIAFESMCLRRGWDQILQPRYDAVREYVRYGRGARYLCVPADLTEERTPSDLPKVDLERNLATDEWHATVTDLAPK